MVQAHFNILKKTSYTFVTFWWALGQLKCTYRASFVVEDDSESDVLVCALLGLTKKIGDLYYVSLSWYMIHWNQTSNAFGSVHLA